MLGKPVEGDMFCNKLVYFKCYDGSGFCRTELLLYIKKFFSKNDIFLLAEFLLFW